MATDADVIRSIGALEESVKNLAIMAGRMEDRALGERHAIYDKLDALQQQLSALMSRFEVNESKVKKMEPIVDAIDDSYQRSQGARKMGGFMWTVIVSLITGAVTVAAAILNMIHNWGFSTPSVPGAH